MMVLLENVKISMDVKGRVIVGQPLENYTFRRHYRK